ncbi:MAG TPA: carbonic anhydrase family protein [Candidatus Aquabacterium excrementipullorum]|nr:carbonic anhydrase family protein [Candidatus Aquabacterium excrementipullorum]
MTTTPARLACRVWPLLIAGALSLAAQAAEHGAASAPAKEIVEKADKAEKADKSAAPPHGNTRSSLAPSSPARTRPADAPAEAASGVSMTELRDLIDQKIAEVRAKQEAAPVVKLNNNAPAAARKAPVKKKPAAAAAADSNSAQATALAGAHRNGQPMVLEANEQPWAYAAGPTGPDQWGKLKPEFAQCGSGKRQSPIDIRDGIKVTLDPIQFDYHASGFRVLDTGRTVQVNVEAGNSITVNGRRYELQRIEFHRPSEERINGRQFEMSAHLVHRDSEGRTAVVAVLMDQGKDHPMVQLVWNSLPLEKHTDQASAVAIDMAQMLPEQKQYLTYMGSLTAPPCTEGVLWMVMKQPATLSRDQIAVFSRLYPMNARPLQPAFGRLVKDGQ